MARPNRISTPVDARRLEELALAYVARFATTRAKLEAYLRRKLRERGWDGEGTPPVEDIAARMVDAGYVDDAVFARAKTGSLLRRGYGSRRVGQALAAAGIDDDMRDALRPRETQARQSALTMARKRGFGPFGPAPPDQPRREKQLAAMLRAGHAIESARAMVDAPDVETAEQWAMECSEEDEWDMPD